MAEIEKRHHLHIVLTPRQYRLLCSQAKQCRLTKRAYLASLIEGQPGKSRPSQEIKDLRTEIHHIGNNINQIAVRVNSTNTVYRDDLKQIEDGMERIWQQLKYFQSQLQCIKH